MGWGVSKGPSVLQDLGARPEREDGGEGYGSDAGGDGGRGGGDRGGPRGDVSGPGGDAGRHGGGKVGRVVVALIDSENFLGWILLIQEQWGQRNAEIQRG